MGAGQSLSIGLHNLDHFAYIGAFSGGPNRNEWDKMDPNILNQKLKVLLDRQRPRGQDGLLHLDPELRGFAHRKEGQARLQSLRRRA